MLFRQLFEPRSCTYTYLLGDEGTGEAVLIDPVWDTAQRDAALVQELGLTLLTTLETHVHADHVTGGWLLRRQFGNAIALSRRAGATGADRLLVHGDRIAFGSHVLEVRETPGHTDGCLSFVLDGGLVAFTGDALLIRGAGRTDFQQGDARTLYRSVTERLLTLPRGCLLYPAHDYKGRTVTTVAEELAHNPRLGGDLNEDDFVGYMDNLNLPHPKQIDVAVPANLRCGAPDADGELPPEPDWAPLRLTYAGIWEVSPGWLEEHAAEVTLLDVRPTNEFRGALGHLAGSISIPLSELPARAGELPKDKPIVTICRAGGRSAQATVLLERAGITRAANLAGGLLRWHALGLPAQDVKLDAPVI
jgi:glyoxylase-like metal-dependent hydrolase (beta-lactamase superfamily II)/rhodanese-related sulfurtransferase